MCQFLREGVEKFCELLEPEGRVAGFWEESFKSCGTADIRTEKKVESRVVKKIGFPGRSIGGSQIPSTPRRISMAFSETIKKALMR